MPDITDDDVAKLKARLRIEEGVRPKPYRDSEGKLTIGVGRNLDDVGLFPDEIDYLLANDLRRTEALLNVALPWWRNLSAVRQSVLFDMCFNMGLGWPPKAHGPDDPGHALLSFTNTLADMQRGDFAAAAKGMLASKWAGQVGHRAAVLARMMELDRYV